MQLTPLIAIHMTAALAALALGPVALWARRGHAAQRGADQRPRLHRAAGYAWVTLMLVTALSAIFISDPMVPNIAGFSAIHLLIPVVLGMLFLAFRFLLRGNIRGHRLTMVWLYLGGCIVAGVFTLAPDRTLGQLVWSEWLELIPTHQAAQPAVPSAPERLALQRQPR